MADRLAIKFFFYIRTDFIPNSIIFFSLVIIFNQKKFVHHNFLHERLFKKHYM